MNQLNLEVLEDLLADYAAEKTGAERFGDWERAYAARDKIFDYVRSLTSGVPASIDLAQLDSSLNLDFHTAHYDAITGIIFKCYPRIKGAYCASIAYGVIHYMDQIARRSLTRGAPAEPVAQVDLENDCWMDISVSEIPGWEVRKFKTRTLYAAPVHDAAAPSAELTEEEQAALARFDKPEWRAASHLQLRAWLSMEHGHSIRLGAQIENLQDELSAGAAAKTDQELRTALIELAEVRGKLIDAYAELSGLGQSASTAGAGSERAPSVQPELTVWYGPMPESNGKSNFTAVLMRKDSMWDGPHVTIERSEYPDRIRYEADRVRYLIGELAEEPFILDYDADKHSGYVAPGRAAQPVQDGEKDAK